MSDASDGVGPFSTGSGTWPGISKLIEECGEVVQVAGKLIGAGAGANVNHRNGTDMHHRLDQELGVPLAAVDFVVSHALPMTSCSKVIFKRRDEKLALFNQWHEQATAAR